MAASDEFTKLPTYKYPQLKIYMIFIIFTDLNDNEYVLGM